MIFPDYFLPLCFVCYIKTVLYFRFYFYPELIIAISKKYFQLVLKENEDTKYYFYDES